MIQLFFVPKIDRSIGRPPDKQRQRQRGIQKKAFSFLKDPNRAKLELKCSSFFKTLLLWFSKLARSLVLICLKMEEPWLDLRKQLWSWLLISFDFWDLLSWAELRSIFKFLPFNQMQSTTGSAPDSILIAEPQIRPECLYLDSLGLVSTQLVWLLDEREKERDRSSGPSQGRNLVRLSARFEFESSAMVVCVNVYLAVLAFRYLLIRIC